METHHGHGWCAALANNRATPSKSMLSPQKKKERDASKPMHNAGSENHRGSDRGGKHLSDSQANAVPCPPTWSAVAAIPESSRFIPLHQRAGKCVAKISFTNESKVAAIGAPVWNYWHVNLHAIWHSDCLCGWTELWIWLLMAMGYTWNNIFNYLHFQDRGRHGA